MPRPREEITIGQIFEFPYPFVRFEYEEFDDGVFTPTFGWNPGTTQESDGLVDFRNIADGIGKQILTVISLHKPGNFPERVFYSRKWRDPDGKEFGKGKLRIRSVSQFRILAQGFRHRYDLITKDAA